MKRSGVRLSSGPLISEKEEKSSISVVRDVLHTSAVEVGPIFAVEFRISLVAHLKLNRK